MTPSMVFKLSLIGMAIVGADGYWQIHSAGTFVMDAKFWVGMAFATLNPVGSYLVGLVQRAPWDVKKADAPVAPEQPKA